MNLNPVCPQFISYICEYFDKSTFEFSRFYCIKDTGVFGNFEHFILWQKIIILVAKAVRGMNLLNIILFFFKQFTIRTDPIVITFESSGSWHKDIQLITSKVESSCIFSSSSSRYFVKLHQTRSATLRWA